jgi:hypothetical protein
MHANGGAVKKDGTTANVRRDFDKALLARRQLALRPGAIGGDRRELIGARNDAL